MSGYAILNQIYLFSTVDNDDHYDEDDDEFLGGEHGSVGMLMK